MRINIKSTNLRLTPEIEDYVNKKINSLEKFIDNLDETVQAWVEVGTISKHHQSGDIYRAEIQIKLPFKKGVRAVSQKETLFNAISDAKDEIKKELVKIKDKKISLRRKSIRFLRKLIPFKHNE